ncbi:proline--tRNA ligase [Patescibacteria group bacterium]|nr:proline--tRNA ligase [Patescibacteria group bacterium]MBU1967063.1 proline--tRNA ligase [Patescibacteria group bacterium]MBU2543580.1 proline--tRNA ligase [Patescibacteria group bacterium]
MKYSQLFGKATKDKNKDTKFASHYYLTKGGFIRESTAGRYYFLPLGWRVHEKIKRVIKEEMDRAGAQEMITPILHPLELWKETNRTNSAGFELTTLEDRRGAQFALGGTAEEMFVDLVRRFQLSYRDLPFNVYQFSTKFRDELRSRGGLLRVREFTMKDAYSFHADENDFKREYDLMAKTYSKIFERLGLKTLMVAADNGYIGGEYCHEFQTECELGEGRFFVCADKSYAAHEDVAEFKLNEINPNEEIKKFEIIDQPEWVQTMADNVKHYDKDESHFLKNVVYKTDRSELIIVTIRGDLDVNPIKLQHLLNKQPNLTVHQLEDASEEDLNKIGTKTGYVHSWGHENVIYVADDSLRTVRNFIGGQKEKTTDSFNVNYGRDFKHEIEGDVAMAQDGFLAKDGQGKLIEKHGIEVGNIFQLGYHYTKLMSGATFTDQDGQEKPYYMGCYGIGIGRTMAAIIEKHHDEKGIIWPDVVAPFHAHLVSLDGAEKQGQNVYQQLSEVGVEVLWDDRDESAGAKFADADLIGIPVRLVVSNRTKDKVEYKHRTKTETELLEVEEVIKRLKTNG